LAIIPQEINLIGTGLDDGDRIVVARALNQINTEKPDTIEKAMAIAEDAVHTSKNANELLVVISAYYAKDKPVPKSEPFPWPRPITC
jgi:hypothetical protein